MLRTTTKSQSSSKWTPARPVGQCYHDTSESKRCICLVKAWWHWLVLTFFISQSFHTLHYASRSSLRFIGTLLCVSCIYFNAHTGLCCPLRDSDCSPFGLTTHCFPCAMEMFQTCPAGAQVVGALSHTPKVAGLLPGQGIYPGFRFDPWWGYVHEATDWLCLSHSCFSLSVL